MKTVVLDVETIADRCAMERCGYELEEGVFAPWPLHQLACASMLTVHSSGRDRVDFELASFSRRQLTERGIVASVERAIEDADQVMTYNGRSFDIPVLLARAVVTDEFVPTLARLGHRCRPGLHYDLHDQIKGPAGGIKLAHFCAAFSIPAKSGGYGGGVAELAAQERWLDIEHYCETDVVATWLAAQMWESSEDPGLGAIAGICSPVGSHIVQQTIPGSSHFAMCLRRGRGHPNWSRRRSDRGAGAGAAERQSRRRSPLASLCESSRAPGRQADAVDDAQRHPCRSTRPFQPQAPGHPQRVAPAGL